MAKGDTDIQLAAKHKYRLPNGDMAVNVTAISGLMDNGKSGAFAGAAVKLVKAGEDYRAVWRTKADRGTRVHGHLESFLRGEDIDQQDDEKGFVDALESFILDHKPTVIAQEEIVLSSLGYGGRFDLLCEIDGQIQMLDLKSGGVYPVEHALQLSAYCHADGIATYDDDGNLESLEPLPAIEKAGCLYVREDGSYLVEYYPIGEDTFHIFCNLLEAYRWTRTDEIKALTNGARDR